VLLAMVLMLTMLTSACYHRREQKSDAMVQYSERQIDSLTFQSRHHYTNNYNFVVKSDSLVLMRQQPEELMSGLPTDTVVFHKARHVVVADIRILPTDSIDSVWVQLASDRNRFGWVHETEMLPRVVPDDPISQFISTFSDVHLLIFLFIIAVIGGAYLMRRLLRENAYIVHLRDIPSFYPTLLCLIVASAATLYASIQMYAPDVWRHFYYHPTLNPFSVPLLLEVFLLSVWAMLIVGLAAVDDVRRLLPATDALMYLSGLVAVCAVDYIVFSISTLYYIGYALLVLYFYFALTRYHRYSAFSYVCGNCGARMRHKGRCPHCGAMNK